ncbi:hypothetical protein ACFSQP_03015 [Bizionia sediminis]|uniref:Uncharacterized protein n=1 Tax=Bizionia sediminis TaxID=1737064 RepID=A0ABW5KR02_9FLAO
MLFSWWTNLVPTSLFIDQTNIVMVLGITVVFFLILLILGIRKSIILKKENDRLSQSSPYVTKGKKEAYKDFTEGHIYENK